MASAREDYLIRMLKEMSAILRRLRERLAGASGEEARAPAELAAIGRETDDAIAQLLGEKAGVLRMLDAATAARLVGRFETVTLWADFVRVQGEAARLTGDTAAAASLLARADALDDAARRAWPEAR